jgi:hypothetical protein
MQQCGGGPMAGASFNAISALAPYPDRSFPRRSNNYELSGPPPWHDQRCVKGPLGPKAHQTLPFTNRVLLRLVLKSRAMSYPPMTCIHYDATRAGREKESLIGQLQRTVLEHDIWTNQSKLAERSQRLRLSGTPASLTGVQRPA